MNPILERLFRKAGVGPAELPASCTGLLGAVSAMFDEMELDRHHLEHTLEVTSDELNEANELLRKEAEGQIRRLNSYYRQVLEGQQGMILCFKREGGDFVHTLCRGHLARRLGWTAEAVEGRRLGDFLPSEDASALRAVYQRAWSGEECTHEGRSPDGRIVYLAQLHPHKGSDSLMREVIVSAVEITERKRAEAELMAAKEHAESADKAKSGFLAVMSHEIRTPLNAILGFSHLLAEACKDSDQKLWINTIDQSGRALQALINDILDFSKIEAGQLDISTEPFRLIDVLQSVITLFAATAASKDVGLELRLEAGLPDIVVADQARLRQILSNLLSNALKFTEKGAVSLLVKPGHAYAKAPAAIQFAVSDTGIGIPDSVRERLFKPFGQADSSTTRRFGGTGLGLVISRRLAEAMGGDLDFTSEPGAGSIFTLTLPVEPAAEQGLSAIVPPAAPAELAGIKILVVEDNTSNQLFVLELLRKVGVVPKLAADGAAAVAAVEESAFDLILMDVQMPGMDGLEATRRIRKMGLPRQPRIAALTASVFPEQKKKCMDSGMDAVLCKPLAAEEVLRELSVAARLSAIAPPAGQAPS